MCFFFHVGKVERREVSGFCFLGSVFRLRERYPQITDIYIWLSLYSFNIADDLGSLCNCYKTKVSFTECFPVKKTCVHNTESQSLKGQHPRLCHVLSWGLGKRQGGNFMQFLLRGVQSFPGCLKQMDNCRCIYIYIAMNSDML